MKPRVNVHATAPYVHSVMTVFDAAACEGLEPALVELVRVRASQLNGCAFCRGLHTRAALDAGEDPRRLDALSAWRESPLFTDAESAALALTESVTLIAEKGVPDEVLDAAAEHFDDTGLVHLLWTIAAINAWNRIGVATAAGGVTLR
ncbi:carboxymuconolactone decarboxylase family protein [Streptosporangium sp. NPDC006013]|uniref:carboxymuconolactone decarboxylase family protein n=1 Tax=Streptosporangium sp. NPDC006013 TaxID=3155596 RepID=UPI0033AC34C8